MTFKRLRPPQERPYIELLTDAIYLSRLADKPIRADIFIDEEANAIRIRPFIAGDYSTEVSEYSNTFIKAYVPMPLGRYYLDQEDENGSVYVLESVEQEKTNAKN